jgi:sodium pump decarboxylase gamma subunit
MAIFLCNWSINVEIFGGKVMNIYVQGLTISVLGMGLTFLALGLLILAMIFLERFFRNQEPSAEAEPVKKSNTNSLARSSEDEAVVVAIATALAYLHSQETCETGLGSSLKNGPTRWWVAGRAQQSPADVLKINHWRN